MQPALPFSTYLISLPFEFIRWWLLESTVNLLKIMRFIFVYFYRELSINLLLKTYFKPWKNEYRQGLVRFALFMGIFLKTSFLLVDVLFFAVLATAEIAVLIVWVLLPFIIIWGFYAAIFPK